MAETKNKLLVINFDLKILNLTQRQERAQKCHRNGQVHIPVQQNRISVRGATTGTAPCRK